MTEPSPNAARRPAATVLGIAAVCLIGVVLAVVVIESALWLLDLPKEQPVGWAWRGDPGERNELGFRGHRGTGRVDDTIMLVGDSQVETEQAFARMPEVLLSAVSGTVRRLVSLPVA